MGKTSRGLMDAASALNDKLDLLSFAAPVSCVYNPLRYAWDAYSQYLTRYATGPRSIFFLGMNPGPWGMAQTGIPFGEIEAVRSYLKIQAAIGKPSREHPKRPIEGLACTRSEVSGKRLWGLFETRYADASDFFKTHFVANYCPLVFMDEGARNITPDKLAVAESRLLDEACDEHLQKSLLCLKPIHAIGIGAYAEACLKRVCLSDPRLSGIVINKILHPSPASPAANRGWAEQATKQLEAIGLW
jgi:single-strand selective monofunctional uracil DNA glycosylase